MPFQPLPEDDSAKPQSSDLGLLVVRFLSILSFFYYQLVDQLNLVRLHIWEKAEWPLVISIEKLSLPMPGIVAVAAILLLTIAALGIAVGFFSRLNGLIAFLFMGCVLFLPLEISKTLSPQAIVLYLFVFFALAIGGGGKYTLDHFFSLRKKEK